MPRTKKNKTLGHKKMKQKQLHFNFIIEFFLMKVNSFSSCVFFTLTLSISNYKLKRDAEVVPAFSASVTS